MIILINTVKIRTQILQQNWLLFKGFRGII
jgi:hypothetical protein